MKESTDDKAAHEPQLSDEDSRSDENSALPGQSNPSWAPDPPDGEAGESGWI